MDINQLLFLGANKYGQAGIGEKYHNKTFTVPKSFAFPTFIKQISCGSHHSALLTIDGNIYTMGSNIHGALGSNTNINYSFVPTLVEGLNDVTKIDCGPFHMCAISNGELYSWGKGIDGQLGHGNTKNISKPMKVEALDRNVEQVSCGTNHTLVLLSSNKGDVTHRLSKNTKIGYAFGNGIYGQLGSGQSKNSYLPTKIKLDNIQSIAAGENHSLFISNGNLYSCGDNSSGQLGIMFNKKFLAEPTYVEINTEKKSNIKLIQAKRYSLALTDSGDMYVWGLKNTFGAPKIIRSDEKNEVEVIDIRVSNEHAFGLASEGTLYSWGIKDGEVKANYFLAKKSVVVSNGRAVLDFSAGDNYILIQGDIVKQVAYSAVAPPFLSCYDEIDSIPEPTHRQPCFTNDSNLNSERQSVQSRFLQESKETKENIIDSKYSQMDFNDSQGDFLQKSSVSRDFNKMKANYDASQLKSSMQEESIKCGLFQRKDFNNLKAHMKQKMLQELRNTNKMEKKVKLDQRVDNFSEIDADNYDLIKTPSSSILCQPSNFLKESTRKENYEIRKGTIYQSGVDQESLQNQIALRQDHNWKKKKYSYNYLDEKENISIQKNKMDSKRQKKFDRIMEMIERSNHIGSRDERNTIKISDQEWENQSEVVKSNKLLRVQLRDKELKISQLQEILSRKEMEIQAQREVIRALREKNNSNYTSEQ